MKGVDLTVTWDVRELKQLLDECDGGQCQCKHGVCLDCEDCQQCRLFQELVGLGEKK